jgi:hypothetical protein
MAFSFAKCIISNMLGFEKVVGFKNNEKGFFATGAEAVISMEVMGPCFLSPIVGW